MLPRRVRAANSRAVLIWSLRVLGLPVLVGMCSLASADTAETLRVEAPIVAVETLYQPAPLVCDQPPPAHSEGFAATLRWDLFERCRQDSGAPAITGYRVSYEWDGQQFSTVVAEPPSGDTLPLSLRLR